MMIFRKHPSPPSPKVPHEDCKLLRYFPDMCKLGDVVNVGYRVGGETLNLDTLKGLKTAALRLKCPFDYLGGACRADDDLNWKCHRCKNGVEYILVQEGWAEEKLICRECKVVIDPTCAEFQCSDDQCNGFASFGYAKCKINKVKQYKSKVLA